MKLRVVWITAKTRSKEPAYNSLTQEYVARISRFTPIEAVSLPNEAALLKLVDRKTQRTPPLLVLLDIRGKQMTSEQFAQWIESQQANDVQQLIFAIGPANGFSDEVRQMTGAAISLGKMTLAHELARVVLLEQIYRAFTIIKRYPYHCGH
jgi:23S rRNA (pseudouridine1915-N3)-methyltransferase